MTTSNDAIGRLTFQLKMLSERTRRHVLVSAGSPKDKQTLLPAMMRLARRGVTLYATRGTLSFLHAHGVQARLAEKIAHAEDIVHVATRIENDDFDLVINILRGDRSYDEASDAATIRLLAVRHDVPLITDVQVAVHTIEHIIASIDAPPEPNAWDLRSWMRSQIAARGGWACNHAHLDKAYLITPQNLALSQVDMQKKWELYRHLKQAYTHDDLVERMMRGVRTLRDQGCTYLRTMVDADAIVGTKCVEAAMEVKRAVQDEHFVLHVGIQPLEGVLDADTFARYRQACEMADFCGGLPSRDRPRADRHLDVILDLARDLGKCVDVHVDQENNPLEHETYELARKTMEHGMEGRVFAIHAISVAAQAHGVRQMEIQAVRDAGIEIVCCPSAALSMKALHVQSWVPIHNSITCVPEWLRAGVPVSLGVDNVHDLFMPFVDGDLWTETRLLMEACRFYDADEVVNIVTRRPNVATITESQR